jgi:hypothetical protein
VDRFADALPRRATVKRLLDFVNGENNQFPENEIHFIRELGALCKKAREAGNRNAHTCGRGIGREIFSSTPGLWLPACGEPHIGRALDDPAGEPTPAIRWLIAKK